MIALLLGLSAGSALTVQSSVNARLRRSVGSPFVSSLVSFVIGTLFLMGVVAVVDRRINLGAAIDGPWWIWLGGALGVCFLTMNLLMMPRIGAVETGVFPLVGQVVMGLVIDSAGILGAPHHAFTTLRALGAVLVLAGASAVAIGGARNHAHQPHHGHVWFWRVGGVVAGMMSAAQTSINGRLGVLVDSPRASALVSFCIGTLALVLLNLALSSRPKLEVPAGERGNPWWMWTGGLLGALYVMVNAALAPTIGTGMTIVLSLLGMTLASVVVDRFGLLHNPPRPVGPIRLVGLLVLVAGVAMIRLL
ncbi:DMT family transporter [Luteococcus sediminum]